MNLIPRIGIVPGHSIHDPGCVVGPPIDKTEHEWALEFSKILSVTLQDSFEPIIYFRDHKTIAETYDVMSQSGVDASIEIHVNSDVSGQAQGTETLSNPKWTDYASAIQNSMVNVLGRQGMHNRGIRIIEFSDTVTRGWENVHSIDFPNCLIEPFFGNNVSECKLILERQEHLAEYLAKAIETYFLLDTVRAPGPR